MKLHWSPKSPYVRKVMICMNELQLDGKIELVRSVAAMLKPNADIMKDNPLSKIPTLVLDDGSSLFDSSVICQYLNELGKGTLFPSEGTSKWQSLRWQALGDGMTDALILWRNEREREFPNPVLMDAFDLKVRSALAMLDAEVSDLKSSPFSIGLISLCCSLGYLDYRFDAFGWRTHAPALSDWYASMLKRTSIQSTAPVDG